MTDPRARHIVLGAALVRLVQDEVARAVRDIYARIRTGLDPSPKSRRRRTMRSRARRR